MTPRQIEPAACKSLPWPKLEKLFADDNYIIEPKLDGWRFLLHFYPNQRPFLTGRHISKQTRLYSEKGLCAPQLTPPPNLQYPIILDGEIMPPSGRNFRDIAGIMNVAPDKALARIKQIGHPQYVAFDVLTDKTDLTTRPYTERREHLYQIITHLRNPFITAIPSFPINKLALFDQWTQAGGEGAILKNMHAAYDRHWYKAKRYSTLDVIVTGFTDADYGLTGKFDGLIGAITVGVYDGAVLREVGNVSGMNDQIRRHITANKDLWLNTVIEIRAQELAKDRLRHPRFIRHRPDKSPLACTWSKMILDLKAVHNAEVSIQES